MVLYLLMTFLFAGCHVDQKKEVEIYREVTALREVDHDPAKPLTLIDALLLANRDNEDIAIQGEQYLRALIDRRRAAAGFLPTVNLVGSYVKRDPVSSGNNDNGGGGSNSQNSSLDVSADLNWELFNGFQDVNRYWRDTYFIEQRRNALLSFQESLLLDVANTYYQILRSEASVRVLENSLQVQEERLRDTRGRLDAGVARPLDLAQTEAQVSATRTTLINARRDVRNARDLLELLTNANVAEAQLVDRFDAPHEMEPIEMFLDRAVNSRSDLAAADAAIGAARRNVEVEIGQYYPSISLNLEAFLYRESVPEERDWTSLLEGNLPIFSAGRIEADVRAAWSFFRESQLLRALLERQIAREVRQAYFDLIASDARMKELHVRLAAADQASQQSEASYRVGLATNLERVAAQDALLEAQLQLTSEQFDRKVLYLILLRSIGMFREEIEKHQEMASDTTLINQ